MPLTPLAWSERYLFPLLAAAALWGLLTAALLWVNQRGTRWGRLALVATLPVLALAHHQLYLARDDLGVWGCYRAFAGAMIIWSWHELAFYSGVLSGPWRSPCPPFARGYRRFSYALATHLYHELAVGVEVILLWRMHLGASNVFGPLTFVLLWALLHSAKLNVFFGVRNLTLDWLPTHLRYLGSFWRPRLLNPFFLPSVAAFSLLAITLWLRSGILGLNAGAIGMTLLAGLTTLGVFEHWLLVWPLSSPQPAIAGRRPGIKN